MTSPTAILGYLASLAPTRRANRVSADVVGPADVVWLGSVALVPDGACSRADGLDRLAATDALDPHHDRLRVGWGWMAGAPVATSGMVPLVSRRVELADGLDGRRLVWKSDLTVHPLFDEVVTAEELERIELDGLEPRLLAELCARLDWPPPSMTTPDRAPTRSGSPGFRASPGAAAFLTAPDAPTTVAAGLGRWSDQRVEETAFAHLYELDDAVRSDDEASVVDVVETSLPVNARQRAAIAEARRRPVSVVSGPPGTGKTHLVAAAAIDAVANGQAVLVVTQSDHAAESVCELLDRYPAPPHLRFGRSEHRRRVVEELSAGRHQAPSDAQLDGAAEREGSRRARRDEIGAFVRAALERETALESGLLHRDAMGALTADAPGVLDDSVDLADAERLLASAVAHDGLLGRFRAGRSERRLRSLVEARAEADLDSIRRAIAVARSERDVEHALRTGGTSLDTFWAQLASAEDAWRAALAELVDVRRRRSGFLRRRRARASVGALASVMRTGAERRTSLLSEIDSDDFLDLLPMWVGTLDEVERTLPAMPGLFDLVILDEASQIDQLQAAGALCRGERVMVVGDPRQLRHVSFVSDEQMDDALSGAGFSDPTLRRLLDVRRNSIFDIAAAAAPVVWLDEHFRSVPHLIGFSAERFYDGELRLMTQHPLLEGHDAVEHLRVEGARDDGVNLAEVDAVRRLVEQLRQEGGAGSIGVVSPFRKQADAIVAMLLDDLSLAEIRDHEIRAGTVHGFQGSERDTVIISLGIGPEDLGRSLRFIEEPGLFNVMITRARRRVILLHSFDPADLPRGLLADYLRHVDEPPSFDGRPAPASSWVREMASALTAPGVRVVTDYPVAGWTIDIALSNAEAAIGIECTVHPDGPDAHIERHLTLRRAGWHLTDAFQSRWMLRPEEAAAHLASELARSGVDIR